MSTVTLDLTRALTIARRAAERGADIAMKQRKSSKALLVESKGTADFVTNVDRASQEAIVREISTAYPAHRVLAEEQGADGIGDPTSPFRWIIDPLDGTVPYIHGRDDFGVIIALQEDARTILGVMVLPARDEIYWGIQGGGAFFNKKKVTSLRNTQNLHDAILCTNTIQVREEVVTLRFPLCASLQNYGCAASELGDIVRGCNDGAFFRGPHLWDVAAGCLLVQEAGGKAETHLLDPNNARGGVVCVASTQPIYDPLHRFVFGS